MRIMLISLCFFIFAATSAFARDKLLEIQEVTSPGGIKAWLVQDTSVPVIAVEFSFKGTGAVNDPPDKQGLSRLASNTMDEGAGPLDSQAFQKELRDQVISLSFNSSRDNFGGSVKTLTKNKDRAFELLRLALNEPRFDEEPVGRMREANQSRIRSSLTDPEWMAARILNDVAFAGHPYSQNSGGTLSSLTKITPDDLRIFSKTLSKDKLYIAVTGDITAEALGPALDAVFGALPSTAPRPEIGPASLQNQGKIFVYKKDIPQTVIEMIEPGIDRKDPDYHIAQVMNFILGSSGFGSRLTMEIREKRGLTYGIYSYFSDMDKFDSLSVTSSTKSESAKELLDLVGVEWKKMTAEPVSEKELSDAKSYLIGSLPLSLTSTDAIAGLLLSLQVDGMPVDYLDQRETAIRSTTAVDIQRVAQRLLDPAAFVTVLVGQPAGIQNAVTVESLPNVE
jgi:zinc protease